MKEYCQFDDLRKLADALEAAVDEMNDRLITPAVVLKVGLLLEKIRQNEAGLRTRTGSNE